MRYLSAFSLIFVLSCASLPINPDDIPQRDYVALGDSVTAGVGVDGTVDVLHPAESINQRKAYPYLIAKALGRRHANLAAPGARSDDVLRIQVPLALGLRPNIATVFCGGNDLVHGVPAEVYGANLEFILAQLEFIGTKVYVLNLPDVWAAPKFQKEPDDDVTPQRVLAFNRETARAADLFGATLVDISGLELVNPDLLANDGFHVRDSGHVWLAQRILKTMAKSK